MGPHKYRRHFFFESFNGRSSFIDLGLCITARPAPRTSRPLAGLPNPYPYGCSVLCNHPKDPELKDVIWRPRIPLTQDGGTEHFENAKMLKRNNRTGSSSDVASIYHHSWEQKIVSNALGSYAGKDSAYPASSSVNQLAIRRCASGGPSPVERRLTKSEGMLVLDLRPWKSFDNISNITDYQNEPLDNFERFELKSPRTRMHDKPGRQTRAIRKPETFLSKSFKESLVGSQSDGMATGELDLVVAGTHQKIRHIRTRDSNLLQRSPLVLANNIPSRKLKSSEITMKQRNESLCDIESNSSKSSIQETDKPVIWVDIVRKLPTPEVLMPIITATDRKLPASVRAPNNDRQRLLPVAFQIYLQKNFNLMTEVEMAKSRRSDNRQIFRTEQEDDVNWTSFAPRPSEWLRKPALARKKNRTSQNVNFEKWLGFTDGLEGIHLQGREPRKTNPLPPFPRNSTKKIENHQEWARKRVNFEPINPLKPNHQCGKQRRRRRAKRKTKKGKKIPKQLSSKGGRGLRNSDSTIDDITFTGYDANSLSGSMREMDLSDGFPHTKIEDEPVLQEPKFNENSGNNVDVQPPEVCERSNDHKRHSLEDLEESLRNIQVQDDQDINQDILNQAEVTAIIEDMTWLYFPRAGNNFGARFELPIDLRKLKTMTPLEYLSEFVVATRCRQRLNDVVFERHATESMLPCEKLFVSLTEILGFHLDCHAEEKLSNLIDLVSVSQLSRRQFAGIGALAERIGRSGISRRDDLELADFNLLHQKMTYLEMDQFLRRLFMFICEIDID